MELFLSELEEVADVVIIDGPLSAFRSMILASRWMGFCGGQTPYPPVLSETSWNISSWSEPVVGVVLNRIPLRGADYYAGNSYVYTYYSSNYGDEREGKEKQNFSGSIFFIDLEKLRAKLSHYVSKATGFIKHLFKVVFKLSPK
jgi:hypothetical protein